MSKTKFYECELCGNFVGLIRQGDGTMICCGKPMTNVEANTKEASLEKHIPVIEVFGDEIRVKVGSIEHPMTEEHHIEWICIMNEDTTQRKSLNSTDKPEASFVIKETGKIKVYAYCNLHGLWMTETYK